MAKQLELEGNKTKHLLNSFSFIYDLPAQIETAVETVKLYSVLNPIEIQICGMFLLNYFILYAV